MKLHFAHFCHKPSTKPSTKRSAKCSAKHSTNILPNVQPNIQPNVQPNIQPTFNQTFFVKFWENLTQCTVLHYGLMEIYFGSEFLLHSSSNDYASSSFKLNFTFLKFPLSQRSISLQNDIGSWIALGVLLLRADGTSVVQGGSPIFWSTKSQHLLP